MVEDPRRLEGGKFFLDIAKFILTAVAITSFLTERINIRIGVVGLVAGAVLASVGILVLPPKKPEAEKERSR